MPDTSIQIDRNSKQYELITDALRDAHAMEEQALTMLKGQASRLEHYPQLQQRVSQHLRETEGQRNRVAACLQALGSDNSTLKDMAQKTIAGFGATFNAMTQDEVIKSSLMSASFEHFEIASYESLRAMANALNLPEVARMAEENVQEERAMADWLEEHLPDVTRRYVELALAEGPAKR